MKTRSIWIAVVCGLVLMTGMAFAWDNPYAVAPRIENTMPPLVSGEYGTDTDNQNNAGTNVADGDMDVYLCGSESNHPVEFDITIPLSASPATRAATLRMDVYDIDSTATNPEVDKVYLNGKYLGTLTGTSDVWGVNYFDIPIGTLHGGKNRVKIDINTTNAGWCATIDWGIIKFTGTASQVTITRGWISPVRQKKGMFINLFATVSGKPATVQSFKGATKICDMTDPDGDGTWSCQYQIPTGWTAGWKPDIYIKAKNVSGAILSQWPGVTVQN